MSDYLKLITNSHSDKPKFALTVELLTSAAAAAAAASASLPAAFSVDLAVGVQLDALGLWVGVSRKQSIPIADAFFTWDDPNLGWNRANWKGPYEATEGITILDDETYRTVIKAKISRNYWEGSNDSAQNYENQEMAGAYYFLVDNLDMTATAHLVGAPTAVAETLVGRADLGFKPAGVRLAAVVITPGPIFALSSDGTPYLAGLDFGLLS